MCLNWMNIHSSNFNTIYKRGIYRGEQGTYKLGYGEQTLYAIICE